LFTYFSRITIPDHVQYWLDTAVRDWETVESLQANTPRPVLIAQANELRRQLLEKLSHEAA